MYYSINADGKTNKIVGAYDSILSFAGSPNGAGGTNLFAATVDGVFLSTDNGTNWEITRLTNTFVNALSARDTNKTGVFCSTENGDMGSFSITTEGYLSNEWFQLKQVKNEIVNEKMDFPPIELKRIMSEVMSSREEVVAA